MNKAKLLLLVAGFFQSFCFAQLKSPADFLGYPLGTKYTPHYKIVDYFRHVAAAIPSMVQLTEYGKTNEGRPLLLAFVSSANNIRDLENIRRNNLGLTGLLPAGSSQVPAIVWLSYNVHESQHAHVASTHCILLSVVAIQPVPARPSPGLNQNNNDWSFHRARVHYVPVPQPMDWASFPLPN